MFVNALQLACNKLLLVVHGGMAIFRLMSSEALPSAYTQHKQSYISLIMSNMIMFQINILAVCALLSII